jgi:lia operon protein LiaG
MSAQNAQSQKGAIRRIVIITAIVAAGALAMAAIIGFAAGGLSLGRFGGTAGATLDEAQALALNGVKLVEIRTVSEDIRVREGSGDSIQVRLHGTIGSTDPRAVPHLSAQRQGNTADIRVDRERSVVVGLSWNHLVLEVSIPKGYAGKLSITTVSADIEAPDQQLTELSIETTSGDVRVAGVRGAAVAIRTTSGTLRAENIEAEQTQLSSVSGDISVGRLTGSLRARSTSGDVSIGLPADAGFRLDARSVSGRVTCAFPIQLSEGTGERARHGLVGEVGGGRDQLSIVTVSGDIALKR